MRGLRLAAPVCVAALAAVSLSAEAAPRRAALVVGTNVGLPGDAPLSWAHNDARRVADVFRELGEFDDVQLNLEVDATGLLAALDRSRDTVRGWLEAGDHVVFVFYYSGHADDRGLHLMQTLLPKDELLARLGGVAAQVRVAVIDACQSGELTGVKGVVARPIGRVELLDELDTSGQALLASSGRSEGSQESESLQGSFFTSHFVSGLRGAADVNGDGEVGLREAHAYAYDRTVRSTVLSAAGTQHPTYDVALTGRREVALTWPRRSAAFLSFRARSHGPFLVLRMSDESVVAELPAQPGLTRRVGLPEGRYVVKKRSAEALWVGQVQLGSGADVVLDESEMQRVPYLSVARKGERQPGWLVLSAGLERGVVGVDALFGVEAGYVLDFDWVALWPSLGLMVGRDDVEGRLGVSVLTVRPSLAAVRLFRFSRFNLFLGGSAGAPITLQWVEQQPMRVGAAFQAEALAGTSLWLTDRMGLSCRLTAGGRLLNLESDPQQGTPQGLAWRLALGAQLGVRLRF